jgi:hypothetical protein
LEEFTVGNKLKSTIGTLAPVRQEKKKDECDSKQQVKDPYGFLVCMITCTVLLRECLCTKDGNKDQVDSGHPSN